MVVPVNAAINAYNNVAKGLAGPATQESAGSAGTPSFGDFMQSAVENVIDAQHTAESVSGKALVHQASANQVVVAMNNAQLSLQEFTKIRDSVVSAYEDVMKMPI